MRIQYVGWSLLLLLLHFSVSSGLHPIILVPGDGGSQMEAKLDKPSVVHYLCDKKTNDYYNIWLNLELLVPLIIDCWIDNVRLVYNATTRTTENSPGVEIRVPGFGNTTTVEYLDPSQASPGLYFKSIVDASLIPLGYERNADIRGAPYDFRKAPNEMQDWMKDFKRLVEHTFVTNGNNAVVLICHSMGSPLSLYFLHQQTQSWKDKYIRALITLGGVWGGSVKALKVFAAGDDLGAYVLPSRTLRGEQRTSPSTAWLLPSKLFWKEDETLVSIPNKRNYTIKDLKSFFDDINFGVGYEMRKDTENLLGTLEHPGVETHCLHGSGVSTVDSMSYKDAAQFPDKPILQFGNGDGTVNIRSLRGCLRWQNTEDSKMYTNKSQAFKYKKKWKMKKEAAFGKGRPKVFHEEFSAVDHMAILTDPRVLSYIKSVVGKMNGG